MPRLIAETELKQAVKDGTFIKNGLQGNVEGVKYDFRLGTRVLKATSGRPVDISKLPEKEQVSMAVEPGEVVFVLTEETLDLPDNITATLSQKRKMSHQGIMTLGGFCIDPLYKGRLLVGLYNFSSSPFPLMPGKKLIAAIFYELQRNEMDHVPEPQPILDFPDELVNLMRNYRPVSTQSLLDLLNQMKVEFDEMRNSFTSRDAWFTKFEGFLEQHDKQIEKVLDALDKEVKERELLGRDVSALSKETWKTAAMWAAFGALGIGILIFLIEKLLTTPLPK